MSSLSSFLLFGKSLKKIVNNIINQLGALAVDLSHVASLVQHLGRVSSSPAPIPLKYCNLLMTQTHAYLFVYGSVVSVV